MCVCLNTAGDFRSLWPKNFHPHLLSVRACKYLLQINCIRFVGAGIQSNYGMYVYLL